MQASAEDGSEVMIVNIEMIIQLAGYVISGVVALIVASKQHNKSVALVEYRLKELEDKVDKHNNVIERLYVAEGKIDLLMRRDKS